MDLIQGLSFTNPGTTAELIACPVTLELALTVHFPLIRPETEKGLNPIKVPNVVQGFP